MKTKHSILIGIALLAAAQIACAASANVGAPTPQPVPTAAPPQVIVVQQPSTAPAARDDNGALISVALVVLAMACGGMIGYIARGRPAQPQDNSMPQSLTLTTHNYYQQPPAQLTPFEQYRLLRQRGIAQQEANRIVSEGRAHQYFLPPGQ